MVPSMMKLGLRDARSLRTSGDVAPFVTALLNPVVRLKKLVIEAKSGSHCECDQAKGGNLAQAMSCKIVVNNIQRPQPQTSRTSTIA